MSKFTGSSFILPLSILDMSRMSLMRPSRWDTGVGIPKEEQDRVFRAFEQASGANPAKQQGTGLGLSISSRLVQLMGSSIRLESAPGEGSAFSFAVPLTLGREEDAGTGRRQRRWPT